MRLMLWIALAGALGTLSRYGVSVWAQRNLGDRFAYGTLIVNLLGCLLLGALMRAVLGTALDEHPVRVAVTVGFLGAFTTFSTFGYETMHYLSKGDWRLAAGNVAANLGLGLLAVGLGFVVGRTLSA